MNHAPPALRVDRARLAHARPGDRERLARAFDCASPAATGVPEHGLLLIPQIRIERPLSNGVEGFAGELIDRIRAAKVIAGKGGGADAAVYFADEIALETAIVRAWLTGARLPEAMRTAMPLSDTPVVRWRRHLLSDHRKAPHLVAALVEQGIAAAWLARFADEELAALAMGLAKAYGASSHLTPAMTPADSTAPERRSGRPGSAAAPAAVREVIAIAKAAPLRPGARLFLAVALLAARRPALVATQAFETALAELQPDRVTPPKDYAVTKRRSVLPPPAAEHPLEEVPPLLAAQPSRTARGPAPRRALRTGTTQLPALRAMPIASAPSTGSGAPQTFDSVVPLPGEMQATASAHAGLFFLLNVFLALGLYGDFTDPGRRLRGLSPFELLLLLGRRWIGPDFDADPVAPMLRTLAGLAPRARIGSSFEAPAWQVPADWLAPWPRTRPRIRRGRFGKSHWHAAGFTIADRWRIARSPAWLRRRWVACCARYIEARLMRALGLADKGESVAELIARPGAIRIDGERVEIAFALDGHSLRIRLAGLDRDPGWIPAAGRSIRFRFT